MFWIIGWVIFASVVGLIAKWLHPGEDPVGFGATIGIGVAGSLVGGALSFLLSFGSSGFGPAGLVMSVIGAIIFLWAYRKYRLNQFLKIQGRMPENIVKKK